jgi:hypothetical protein
MGALMKTTMFIAAFAAVALAMTCLTPAPSRAAGQCPAFAIKAEPGRKGSALVFVTISPARDGVTYNWTTSAGTITSGQGTASIAIDVTGLPVGEKLTATVEFLGVDPSCPLQSRTLSATTQVL